MAEETSLYYAIEKDGMFALACRDAGVDCDYVAKGETEEQLWNDTTKHLVQDHEMKPEQINQEFKDSHKSMIKTT